MFVILTPSQIQYGGFIRASMKKIRDMIRDRARILYLIFLWQERYFKLQDTDVLNTQISTKISSGKYFLCYFMKEMEE